MQVLLSLFFHSSSSAFDDAIRTLMKSHPALGTVPLRGTGGDLRKADTVEMEPFAIALHIKSVS
jgi:hypothetical protein